MCTRGVWQLSSVTLRFCKQGGSSEGARQFITGDLRSYASSNESISFGVTHAAGKHPLLVGRYLDGTSKEVDLRNKGPEEIAWALQQMRDTATGRVRKFRQPVLSRVPSVQGVWDPSNTFEGFALREVAPAAVAEAAAAAEGDAVAASAAAEA